MAGANRLSESIAELLCVLLPSVDKLLIWEQSKKEEICILGHAALLGLFVLLQQQQSSNNSKIKTQLPFGGF